MTLDNLLALTNKALEEGRQVPLVLARHAKYARANMLGSCGGPVGTVIQTDETTALVEFDAKELKVWCETKGKYWDIEALKIKEPDGVTL